MFKLSSFTFKVVFVDSKGTIVKRETLTAQSWTEDLGGGINLEMIAIPAGSFLMGSLQIEEGYHPSQKPQHFVNIKPFFLAKYPITQAQWQAVTQLDPVKLELNPYPSNFQGDDRPIEQVSWFEAIEFCQRLAQKTGHNYQLPSEAQWEYACRAISLTFPPVGGTEGGGEGLGVRSTPFHFGNTITTDLANYSGVNWEYMGKIRIRGAYGQGSLGDDRRETTPVGSFQVANAFGLYDMHGLVREWCADDWHDNYEGATTDGTPWITSTDQRVLRGGSWNSSPRKCRSAYRDKFFADASLYDIGFRVACNE